MWNVDPRFLWSYLESEDRGDDSPLPLTRYERESLMISVIIIIIINIIIAYIQNKFIHHDEGLELVLYLGLYGVGSDLYSMKKKW